MDAMGNLYGTTPLGARLGIVSFFVCRVSMPSESDLAIYGEVSDEFF